MAIYGCSGHKMATIAGAYHSPPVRRKTYPSVYPRCAKSRRVNSAGQGDYAPRTGVKREALEKLNRPADEMPAEKAGELGLRWRVAVVDLWPLEIEAP